jgi:gamma-glutamylaminecyclotransferase
MKKHLVFVYGSLKKGLSNHRLLERAEFIGHGHTLTGYTMWGGWFPEIAPCRAGYQVEGEAYLIDDIELQNLDRLESHPRFYRRRRIRIALAGRRQWAWAYLRPQRESRIPSFQPQGDVLSWPRDKDDKRQREILLDEMCDS